MARFTQCLRGLMASFVKPRTRPTSPPPPPAVQEMPYVVEFKFPSTFDLCNLAVADFADLLSSSFAVFIAAADGL
jgi:hypothetical protein